MAHYLVTGGAGFIGSNLAQSLLSQGESVRVLDNFSTGSRENLAEIADNIDIVEGDICNPDDCKRAARDVDYVLHHAALPSVAKSLADPLASHHANATGTMTMLVAARDAKVKRFVYAGSSSAYGEQAGDAKHESMTPAPLAPYAASKLAGEHYVRAFSLCYGLQAVCLRYFNVFGPRQNPDSEYSAVIPRFIKLIRRGERPTIFGDGQQRRDFTFVENNIHANILAATSDIHAEGQIYNIACGESYSILDLVKALSKILDTDIDPIFEPPRPGEVRDSKADITRAKSDLNYKVTVHFEEGLKQSAAWYTAHAKD